MLNRTYKRWSMVAALLLTVSMMFPAAASASESEGESQAAADSSARDSWTFRHQSAVGLRPFPLGLNVNSDTGIRVPIDFGSDSVLFQNLYFEQGLATGLSPAYLWAGPYVEILPIAVLKLRASAQYAAYFGTLGYLFEPPVRNGQVNYSIPTVNDRDNDNAITARGTMIRLAATPQLKAGRIVFTAETTATWMNMGVTSGYYEPFHDLILAPNDRWITTLPTLGYLIGSNLARSYFLIGARADYTKTYESDVSRLLTGLVAVFKLPAERDDALVHTLSGFFAVNAHHQTNGEETLGRVGAPYVGIQYTLAYR